MSYIDLTAENFSVEINDTVPVLVDFWAPWCQPCQLLSPIIEELADELDGSVKVCKLNCDEAGDIAAIMGVMSIPCMILFKNGKETDRLVGLHSKDEILDFINK